MVEKRQDSMDNATSSSRLELHQSLIQQLYIDQDLSLSKVMEVMKNEYGQDISRSMYKKKFREWTMYKSDSKQGLKRSTRSIKVKPVKKYHFIMAQPSTTGSSHKVGQPSSYTIQYIKPPFILVVQEELFDAFRVHVSQRLDLRLRQPGSTHSQSWKNVPLGKRSRLSNYRELAQFSYYTSNAQGLFRKGQPAQAMAVYSQAFQHIEAFVREDHFSIIELLTTTITDLWKEDMVECIPIFIKQVYAMASICHGRGNKHPLKIWAKSMLELLESVDEFIEPLGNLFANVCTEILGPEDFYTIMARSSHHRISYLVKKRKKLIVDGVSKEILSAIDQLSTQEPYTEHTYSSIGYYAKTMIDTEEFQQAEQLLLGTNLRGLDIDHITIGSPLHKEQTPEQNLRYVLLLAIALSGQQKFGPAAHIFVQVIPLIKDVIGAESLMAIHGLCSFADMLNAQNLNDEAIQVYGSIDDRLLPYMLDRR